jgi:hypothetical protein
MYLNKSMLQSAKLSVTPFWMRFRIRFRQRYYTFYYTKITQKVTHLLGPQALRRILLLRGNLWLLVFFVGENWRKWAAPEFPFGDKTGENWAPVSINRQNFFTQIAKSGEIAN